MLRILFLATLLTVAGSALAQPVRTVSITLDDLPYVGSSSLDEAVWATDTLLAVLEAHGAPADVFVTGARTEVEGETEARRDLLRRWRDAGHALQNHSYSHLRYSTTDSAAYLADVARGYALVADLLAETDTTERVGFFRAPFNDLGESAASRQALTESLATRDVRLAPFTVEHGDYAFDAVYRDALARGDTAFAERVGDAYLAQLDTGFAFAEHLAEETFGRPIPQVLLIHANRINADYLDAMLGRLRDRGYAFVSLDEAVADPAYATEDAYRKHWGVSWLHRWRVGLGLPSALRAEPEMPAWIYEAYEALISS